MRPAVQVWVNGDDEQNIGAIADALSRAVKSNEAAEFKAFLIFVTPKDADATAFAEKLAKIAQDRKIENVGFAYLSPEDRAIRGYRMNLEEPVKNTVFVYKNKTVTHKMINLKADKQGLEKLQAAISDITK